MSEMKKTRKKRFDAVHKSIPGLDEADVVTSGELPAEVMQRMKDELLTPENSTIAHRKVFRARLSIATGQIEHGFRRD